MTLKKKGKLRGCIGRVKAVKPVCETVRDVAIESAVNDHRFSAVQFKEIGDISIEISVLSGLKKIKDVEEIIPGEHGIMITKGYASGLLLPQVAVEYGWDRDEFLENVCTKAGLPVDGWKEDADIQIFTAAVFGEHG